MVAQKEDVGHLQARYRLNAPATHYHARNSQLNIQVGCGREILGPSQEKQKDGGLKSGQRARDFVPISLDQP
jgi:hypothetical protein